MSSEAKLRHLRIAPRKVRLVADMVRGLGVEHALDVLEFSDKRAALPLSKLVRSAVANADAEGNVDVDQLRIKAIAVDAGPTLKRFQARAQGRATPRLRRTSHVTLTLEQAGAGSK